ncbi:MAG: hypothetical protein KKB50_05625 [Planctomycetes bacterium]|nr:hypothetical protein [Planctomycetota bacterium]
MAALRERMRKWQAKRDAARAYHKRRRDQLVEYRADKKNRDHIFTAIVLKVGGQVAETVDFGDLKLERKNTSVIERYLRQLESEGLISIRTPEGRDDLIFSSARLTPYGKSRADDILDEGTNWRWFALRCVPVIFLLWLGVPHVVRWLTGDLTSAGSAGDMFGSINALFAGLAFAGVIYAIILQRGELQLQRQELGMTREELRRSAEAQEASQRALAAQVRITLLTARAEALRRGIERIASDERTLAARSNPPLIIHKLEPDVLAERESLKRKLESVEAELERALSRIDDDANPEAQDES